MPRPQEITGPLSHDYTEQIGVSGQYRKYANTFFRLNHRFKSTAMYSDHLWQVIRVDPVMGTKGSIFVVSSSFNSI